MPKKMQLMCQYCDEKIENNNFYNIYRLVVVTNTQLHYIGIKKLLEALADYCMSKGYHLSASEVVLLRPDILKEYLIKHLDPEKPIFYILCEDEICYDCFEEYKQIIPER